MEYGIRFIFWCKCKFSCKIEVILLTFWPLSISISSPFLQTVYKHFITILYLLYQMAQNNAPVINTKHFPVEVSWCIVTKHPTTILDRKPSPGFNISLYILHYIYARQSTMFCGPQLIHGPYFLTPHDVNYGSARKTAEVDVALLFRIWGVSRWNLGPETAFLLWVLGVISLASPGKSRLSILNEANVVCFPIF
jgi:hypothetical protein